MKLFGYEDNHEELLKLTEASIQAGSDELRCIADFLNDVADSMEQHGASFGHEHFRDYAERRGVRFDDATPDLIVARD